MSLPATSRGTLETLQISEALFLMPGCYLLSWHATAGGLVASVRKAASQALARARDSLAQLMDAEVDRGLKDHINPKATFGIW